MTTRESTSDCDYDEEEIIVFADFKNNILNELQTTNPSIKIIGIDSQNPIAEVNGNIFKGKIFVKMTITSKTHWIPKHIIHIGAVDPFIMEVSIT
ncbi:uncharacterized protein LOC129907105 isoform X2 [Episyrphus balteatus]|uniref:uncharacterized protein LOC129907105 isoform X2 n=1 Tax=Episyrphus balteatus TaxID=286459 RepID=UPI0024851140|nr:uncharacterized protein LOC129907105 isoform X2 [Episyrphus balteatus]